MSNEVVLYDKKDSGVALISLNRPDRLNAITGELTARLKEKSMMLVKTMMSK